MKEGDKITGIELAECWNSTLQFYNELIENGFKLRPIQFLVQYIIKEKFSKNLYPGTSLYSLLISLPQDNKVDYSKTLKVQYDQQYEKVLFSYRNKIGVRKNLINSDESLKWFITCEPTEVIDIFNYFISINDDWRSALVH